ncbi:MAG: hypothetical protein NTW12_09555 [Deltaproteobacteria bacterium]|nr:hypothetical protein [Deltaproteobacteria bacterium]
MKKVAAIIFIFVISIMFSVPVYAQTAKDIKGWNKAKWGMTETEIVSVFDGLVLKDKENPLDQYASLRIPKYSVGGIDFLVRFEMGSDDRLRRVVLVHEGSIASHFGQFEQLLTTKYGQAAQKDESKPSWTGYDKTTAWVLPSTKVGLNYTCTRGMGCALIIKYEDRSLMKDDVDKL